MDAKEEVGSGSWWRGLPGILKALGAVITALVGLLAVLHQVGFVGSPGGSAEAHTPDAHTPEAHTPEVHQQEAHQQEVHQQEAHTPKDKVASRLVGSWTWSGQSCADGPRIAFEAHELTFTTANTRFVHRVVSDDGATLRTKVLSPSEHGGEGYRFQLAGNVLNVFEEGNGERNVWTRCRTAAAHE